MKGLSRVALALLGGAIPLSSQAQTQTSAIAPSSAPIQIFRLDPRLDALIAPGAVVQALVTIPGVLGEGPVWRDGKLWFADVASGSVFAIAADGHNSIMAREAGGPVNPQRNIRQGAVGMANWRNGTLLVCSGALREIALFDHNMQRHSFVSHYQGKHLNSPNDLVVAPDGALWFTDPAYSVLGYSPLPGSPRPAEKEQDFNGVYRFYKGKLQAMVTDLEVPNGIAFSPDGKTLYVANSAPEMFVRAYQVSRHGKLSAPRVFATFSEADRKGPGTPDGLKVDRMGNVWVAGPGGVHVFTAAGALLGRIQLPVKPTNLAFGEDFNTMFITAGPTVYRLPTKVAGVVPRFTNSK